MIARRTIGWAIALALVPVWIPIFVMLFGGATILRLGDALARGPYYQAIQWRRRLAGQAPWQPIDLLLGIHSPECDEDHR